MNKQIIASDSRNMQRPSIDRHKHQIAWQILVPIVCWGLIILAVGVMVILRASQIPADGNVSQWADTSTIWLTIPVMMFGIMATLILAGLIFLAAKILSILPQYTSIAQKYVHLFEEQVNSMVEKVVNPIISLKSYQAGLSGIISSILGLKHN